MPEKYLIAMSTDDSFDFVRLDNTKRAELWEEFDTMRLVDNIDALDHIMSIMDFPPINVRPELRKKLFRLHTTALEQQELARYPDINQELFDLAWELEDDVYEIQQAAESILKVLGDLTRLAPDPDDYGDDFNPEL